MSYRVLNFADGFTSANAPETVGSTLETYPLLNNQASPVDITGLLLDNSTETSVFISYEIERIGSSTYRQSGSIIAQYNSSWLLTYGNYQGDSILEDSLLNDESVVLSLSGGQIQYVSGNLPGHTETNLKINILRISA